MAAIALTEGRLPVSVDADGTLVFQRDLCVPPIWGTLSRRLRARLCAADVILRDGMPAPSISSSPHATFPALDSPFWRDFEHPLSWAIPRSLAAWPDAWSERTIGELAALEAGSASLDVAISKRDRAAFDVALLRLGNHGFGEAFAFRSSGWVGTIASSGGRVRFPAPEKAIKRMEEIFTYLMIPQPSALFHASVLKVMMTNAHPLSDGNGRTSRILFNYALRRGGVAAGYLPIKDYMLPTRGHLQIAMRLAETRGQWEPLLHLMCDISLDWATRREATASAREERSEHGD